MAEKKKKIIVFILLIVSVFIINLITFFYIHNYYEEYIGEIISIKNNDVIVYSPICIETTISKENTTIYNERKDIINISNLNEGNIIYIYDKYNNMEKAIIKKIENNLIRVTLLYSRYYTFKIKDTNNETNISKLDVGNTIYIVNKKDNITPSVNRDIFPLHNVKIVKVLDENLNKIIYKNK